MPSPGGRARAAARRVVMSVAGGAGGGGGGSSGEGVDILLTRWFVSDCMLSLIVNYVKLNNKLYRAEQ